MRTVTIEIKNNHSLVPYLRNNTSGSRAVRNTANFLIRNTMTGLQKSPEERTSNETEALHLVFTGIQKANRIKESREAAVIAGAAKKALKSGLTGLRAHARVKIAMDKAKMRFPYPTADKWFLGYEVLDAILKCTDNEAYASCTSQVNQQAIRKTVASWKTYFKTTKGYKKNLVKYNGKPGIPGYIREKEVTAHFTNQVCRLSEAKGKLYLAFANHKELLCIGGKSLIPGKYVKTEVKPYYGGYLLCITYEDNFQIPAIPVSPQKILGLDPGLENFITGVSNTGAKPFIIRGGYIKSLNRWFNKRRAELLSSLTAGSDSKHSRKRSHALNALSMDRDRKLRDFFYKAAHWICRWCESHRIEVVVIGHNESWKQEVNLGKTTNQNFVLIPYARFISILKTVCYKYGLPVVETEESYTSKASLLDGDVMPVYKESKKFVAGNADSCNANSSGRNDAREPLFSGKRIHRGMYRASDGRLLNADVNGAGNIIRKTYPDAFKDKDMAYLCGTVESVTGEKILGVKHKNELKPRFERKRTGVSEVRRRYRRMQRRDIRMAFETAAYSKKAA